MAIPSTGNKAVDVGIMTAAVGVMFTGTQPALAGSSRCLDTYTDNYGQRICETGPVYNYQSISFRGGITTGFLGYGVEIYSNGPGDIEIQGDFSGNGGNGNVDVENTDGRILITGDLNGLAITGHTTISAQNENDAPGEITILGEVTDRHSELYTFVAKDGGSVVFCDPDYSYSEIRNLGRQGNVVAGGNGELTDAEIRDRCDDGHRNYSTDRHSQAMPVSPLLRASWQNSNIAATEQQFNEQIVAELLYAKSGRA